MLQTVNLDAVFDDDRPPGESALTETTPERLEVSSKGYLVPADLPDVWREWYEERAAIREYDGGETREWAEAGALRETRDAMRTAGE